MSSPDHYTSLGVLPSAESVVIRAAYRALAQRYHPDRWAGDSAEAHRRMSAINEAFRILGDEALRAKYDASRPANDRAEYQSTARDDFEQAFSDAMVEQESRWALAVEIFPDLAELRTSLAKTSTTLAFSFVTTLLDSKNYKERLHIAEAFEYAYLVRYFGNDPSVLSYAKQLIGSGSRKAAHKLNQLVDVLGTDVDPQLLIERVEQEFGVRAEQNKRRAIGDLRDAVVLLGRYDHAHRLMQLLGYSVRERTVGFFGSVKSITVTSGTQESWEFKAPADFVTWVRKTHCPRA